MQGKTCVVTGATDGIGLVAAERLAALGARVVLLGRSPVKGERTRARVAAAAGGPPPELMLGDLASLDEVRRLAADLLDRCPRIDVLLNNAGAMFQRRRLTVGGIERTFALNHLAHFLLTDLLRARLEQSAPARVINVSSRAHRGAKTRFDDLNWEREPYSGWAAYQWSKLANVLFTRALAERLSGTGVTANALHPGFVATHFAMDNPLAMRAAVAVAMKLFAISPQAGARTSVYLATAPEVEAVSGQYFVRSRPVEPAAAARDRSAAERLWRLSESLSAAPRSGAPPGGQAV